MCFCQATIPFDTCFKFLIWSFCVSNLPWSSLWCFDFLLKLWTLNMNEYEYEYEFTVHSAFIIHVEYAHRITVQHTFMHIWEANSWTNVFLLFILLFYLNSSSVHVFCDNNNQMFYKPKLYVHVYFTFVTLYC